MADKIWIIAEASPSGISRATRELLGLGKRLAGGDAAGVTALFCGDGNAPAVEELQKAGAGSLLVLDHPDLGTYLPETYTAAIAKLAGERNPETILIPASSNGRELGALLATTFGTGVIQDCSIVERDGETLVGHRACFGGNLIALVENRADGPGIFTVRPKSYPVPEEGNGSCEVEKIAPAVPDGDRKAQILELVEYAGKVVNLAEADIIVAGGRGVGKQEGFEPLKDLADVLGGVLGASRSAVDAGWIDYPHQVGQTGRTVKPKLYFACGISGAIQHIAGMRTSDMIVAINKDAGAPIFKMAHYGIVGDLFEIVPMLTESFREALKS